MHDESNWKNACRALGLKLESVSVASQSAQIEEVRPGLTQ